MIESRTYQTEMQTDAAIFSVLAGFYNINPDRKFMETVLSLDPDAAEDGELRQALKMITSCAAEAAKDEEKLLDIKRDWTKLFRGVSPSYGPKPPYEQLYSALNLKVISELAELYLKSSTMDFADMHNRHDYIGSELEYLSCLAKEFAQKGDDEAQYTKYKALSDDFIGRHLKPWFDNFYENAMRHASTDMYKGVLKLTHLSIYQ